MKTLSFAVSGVRSACAKLALCLLPFLVVATPAAAAGFSFGSIPNPQIAGGTLTGVSNVGISGTTLGFNLTIGNLSAPAQVYLAAYVPAGSLGLTTATWFCYTQNNGWQPLVGSNYLPIKTGVAVGTTLNISLLENTNLNALPKAEVYVGYGVSVEEMIQAARYKGILSVF